MVFTYYYAIIRKRLQKKLSFVILRQIYAVMLASNSGKFIVLSLLLFLMIIINMSSGSVILSADVWSRLWHGQVLDIGVRQILLYRLAKLLTALLTGISLSVSGLILQSIFRNPIVGPYVLGTSAAGGLGVAFLILGSAVFGFEPAGSIGIVTAAATGSVLSLMGIIVLYRKFKSPVNLLIAGLMLGIFSGALIDILSYFTQAEALQKFVFWSMGNLGNQSWEHIIIMGVLIIPAVVTGLFFVKDLNALLLGENYAKSLGVNVYRSNMFLIVISGVLAGVVTAFVGPVAFVGLAVPHIARLIFKTHLHQILLPAVILTGAILLLICDTIAQVPGSVLSLPINSITALFGAPLLVYLILKKS